MDGYQSGTPVASGSCVPRRFRPLRGWIRYQISTDDSLGDVPVPDIAAASVGAFPSARESGGDSRHLPTSLDDDRAVDDLGPVPGIIAGTSEVAIGMRRASAVPVAVQAPSGGLDRSLTLGFQVFHISTTGSSSGIQNSRWPDQ